ncbi:MAG: choice-of-anchor E domain-containing protein [Planctomycetes bacterium]|nr:choice-of-anchor E domain-containing protein [Planctomycetota bacterium]
MLLHSICGRALPALFLGAALIGQASAQTATVQFSDAVILTTTNWDRTVTLPKFDPALGSLISVTLTLDGRIEGQAAVESSDSSPITITTQFKADITLARPDTSVLAVVIPQVDNVANLQPFDGTLDFAGPSGMTFANLMQSAQQSVVSPPPASDLVLFSGPGNIVLPVTARGTSQAVGSGNVTTSFATKAAAVVTVRYLYTPPIIDCNGNLIADNLDIASGFSQDCDSNGVPDECQPDCDNDGIPDVCEPDCDGNGIPNDCDVPCPECEPVGHNRPASLLIYPIFDNRQNNITLISLTNTNCDMSSLGNGFLSGTVDVEFVYIARYGPNDQDLPCLETNRTRRLTPCDTITIWTSADNPNAAQGYVYAFAKSPITGKAIVWNHLIGDLVIFSSTDTLRDSVQAIPFLGIGADRTPTDHDNDGIRDLNNVEYSRAPDELLIPRFLGQDPAGPNPAFNSHLILIGLSGGTQFTTTVNFLIYNDNEEAFSAQYSFRCWAFPRLGDINSAFLETFLDTTNNDPLEIIGRPIKEAGWFKVDGLGAASTAAFIPDPAIYAVLVERFGIFAAAALPFELCSQDNGALLPNSVHGNF